MLCTSSVHSDVQGSCAALAAKSCQAVHEHDAGTEPSHCTPYHQEALADEIHRGRHSFTPGPLDSDGGYASASTPKTSFYKKSLNRLVPMSIGAQYLETQS